MPSEFYPGSFDSREPTPNHNGVSLAMDGRSVLPNTTGQIQTPITFASRACGHVSGTPTSQCYTHTYTPSPVNSLGLCLERQAAKEEIGMAPVIWSHPVHGKERGIIGLLAMAQERVFHFVSGGLGKQKYSPQDSLEGIIESPRSSGKDVGDAQSLASQEQHHVVFSDSTPHKEPEKEPEAHVDTPATLAGGSSGNSSAGGFSIHSRKTPYPSPVVLRQLMLQQAKEEADGSNDDVLKGNRRQKKVRLAHRSCSTRPPSTSSALFNTVRSRISKITHPLPQINSHQQRNGLGRAIKRILFKKPRRQYSQCSGQQKSLSISSQTTVFVETGIIMPTLPQGGTREISINKQISPLMIKGLDRDFLPTEATLVPTPPNSPILSGLPLSFEEAISTLPATTDPPPASSELEQPGMILEHTPSPEVVLTRPLLTQNMNKISPFFKMTENFPAPPTPPLPKAHCSNARGLQGAFRMPKLDTHGLLRQDSHSDKFDHQQKKPARRKSSTTASVIAFLSKPFTKWDKRYLVASVSNEKDKDSARVGLKDRYQKDTKGRNKFDIAYPVYPGHGDRPMTASPALRFTRRASLPVVEEKEFSEDFEQRLMIGAMEHTQEEKPIVEEGDGKGAIAEDNGEKKSEKLGPGTLGNGVGGDTSRVPVSTENGTLFPPLEMSPSPPSPILRPASTIPTTAISGNYPRSTPSPPLQSYLVRKEEETMRITPLPLLPLRGDRDDAVYWQSVDRGSTSNPSPVAQWFGSTMRTAGSEYPEEILSRRKGRVGPYVYKSEAGASEESGEEGEGGDGRGEGEEVGGRRAPLPTRAGSREVGSHGKTKSRGESEGSEGSGITGKTALDTGVPTGKATVGSRSEDGRCTEGTSGAIAVGSKAECGGDEDWRGSRGTGGGGAVEKMIAMEIGRWELMGGRAYANLDDEGVD